MLKKLLLILVLLTGSAFAVTPCNSRFSALAYSAPGCTLNTSTWSWLWPTTSNARPPFNAGWHRDWYNSTLHAFQTWQECSGDVTFSFCFWTYPYPTGGVTATGTTTETIDSSPLVIPNPWILEYTGNDPTGNASTTSWHALVLATVNPTDTTITINCSHANCSTLPSTATSFFCSTTPTGTPSSSGDASCKTRIDPSRLFIRIEDEVLGYSDFVNNFPTAGQGQFIGLVHGLRGTTAATHAVGTDIWQESPFPQIYSRKTNSIINITNGLEPRHPFHDTAINNTQNCLYNFDQQPENGFWYDTWKYCFGNNTTDPTMVKFPVSSAAGDMTSQKRTDGTLESADPTWNLLVQYGGGIGPDALVSLMCLDSTCASAMTGWTPSVNNWVQPTASGVHCYGTLWNGTTCSNPGLPTARIFHDSIWDPFHKRFIIIGGAVSQSGTCVPTSTANPVTWDHTNCPSEFGMNNIWAFDPVTVTFQQIVVTGDIPAPSRRPAATYNSTDHDITLWEGPIVYDAGANPYVGLYESGIYKLNITTATPLPTTGTLSGTWTVQAATGGCVATASTVCPFGPSLPYDQTSNNSSKQGCSNGNLPWPNDGVTAVKYTCDHSTSNLVYDSDHDAYWHQDIDTSTTTSLSTNFSVWLIPGSQVIASGSPNPPSPAPVLTLVSTGSGQASFSWTSSTGASTYQLFKCTGGAVTCGTPPASTYPTSYSSAASATTSLSQTASGLTNGTTYTFVVVATNSAGTAVSNSLNVTPVAGGDVTPNSTQLTFATQALHTTSSAQLLTLQNLGGASVTVNNFAITGDFAFAAGATNPCSLTFPFTINAAASCNLNITFTPTALGTRSGTFTITDTGGSSPQSVGLTGVGGNPSPNIIRGGTIRH